MVSLLLLVASVALLGPHLMRWITLEMKQGFSCGNDVFANTDAFISFINAKFISALLIICPIMAALLVGSVISGVALSGPNFSPKALKLNFKAINHRRLSRQQILLNKPCGAQFMASAGRWKMPVVTCSTTSR